MSATATRAGFDFAALKRALEQSDAERSSASTPKTRR